MLFVSAKVTAKLIFFLQTNTILFYFIAFICHFDAFYVHTHDFIIIFP